jgi:muramoyltetrapeptide carboxypeptidase
MNRKNFISTLIPLAATFSAASADHSLPHNSKKTTVPPYLESGSLLGITSPAGHISLEGIQPAIDRIREWGFQVKLGSTIGKRDHTFGGTDEERIADMQQMLDDDSIAAIMCARGGYGLVRIIDQLDFSKFKKHPKWLIGFSDVTVLHSHIARNYCIATIHSKMCNSFPGNWETADAVQKETIESIRRCLVGESIRYQTIPNVANRKGTAQGLLVGGNLRTLETLSGSRSALDTKGKILFVEDTGEYLYSIDRMLWNLKRSGKLSKLAGLIIGGFKIKKEEDVEDAFGLTLEQIVMEKVAEYNYPVCFDFPVGHQKNNFALKCGMKHHFSVSDTECYLQQNQVK